MKKSWSFHEKTANLMQVEFFLTIKRILHWCSCATEYMKLVGENEMMLGKASHLFLNSTNQFKTRKPYRIFTMTLIYKAISDRPFEVTDVQYLIQTAVYRKNSKIWDTSNNCQNCPKNRKVWCNIALMHPKDADGMANSVDPDQTASSEAVWSWSALFVETYLSQYTEFVW